MKRISGLIAGLVLASGMAAHAAPTAAGLILTNIAKITAGNAAYVAPAEVVVTNARMYGGAVSLVEARVLNITFGAVNTWTFNVTNLGNDSANFIARVVATNRLGGTATSWSWGLDPVSLSALSPMAFAPITLSITNKEIVADGSYFSLLVKFSNTSAPYGARAYVGADATTWYGGDLSRNTNSVTASDIGPVFYVQNVALREGDTNAAGFVTSIVQGPVLVLSKFISSVSTLTHGLTLNPGYAVPGTEITYTIGVTNRGSAAATAVRILDSFTTNFTFVSAVPNGGFSTVRDVVSGSVRVLTFSNGSFAGSGTGTTIDITVRIK